MDLSYVLYDTIPFSTVANAEFILFQTAQGADATHSESFTNMRGSGFLPNEEAFLLKRISVVVDYQLLIADWPKLIYGTFLEVRVSDKTLFKAPIAMLIDASLAGGHFTQAAAADKVMIGLAGDGYDLEIPIKIPGGTVFRVRVVQLLGVTAASSNFKVALQGTLTIPG